MRQFLTIFNRNDALSLALIVVLSITAGRLPEIIDPGYPYPTTLYSIFGSICQTLAPLLAAALFFLLYTKGDTENPHRTNLLKGVLLSSGTILLALVLMPFSSLIYDLHSVRQGVAVGITLFALWSVWQMIIPIVKGLMEGK